MKLSEKNRSYFSSEANKNRDQWTHGDGDGSIMSGNVSPNPFLTGKFDDVIKYKQPSYLWNGDASNKRILKLGNGPNNAPTKLSADGDGKFEYEDEEYFEPEGEEMMVEEPFVEEELPKFRQLVRAKKLEYKALYGKAHAGTRRECKMVPTPSTCYKRVCLGKNCKDVPYPCMVNKEVCINIPTWTWGWRKKWREFKQAGGLAQLKMISRGMAPLVPPSNTNANTTPTGNTPRGGTGRNAGEIVDVGLDSGDKNVSQAGVAGNIIGTILVLGLVFGAIKMMK